MNTHHRNQTNYEQLGWKYKHEGNYSNAIQAFDKAIAHHQKTYFALHGKGECLLRTGDYATALDCFNRAIKIDKNHPWAYHGAGRAYHFLKKYDVALAYYNKSISLNNRSTVAWHWKGRSFIQMGLYNDAINALETAMNYAVCGKYAENQIPLLEQDLKRARELKEEMDKDTSKPIQITVQGDNNAPINVEGIQANDDAQIIRPTIDNSIGITKTDDKPGDFLKSDPLKKQNEARIIRKGMFSYQCSECGGKVKKDDSFCTKCGRKLT